MGHHYSVPMAHYFGAIDILRLEAHRLSAGVSWYESKANIIRSALRDYLAYPKYTLHPTA